MNRLLLLLLLLFILVIPASAANHYVRDGASGDGSDWTNASDNFPATLYRGDTYYVADGGYNWYEFNTTESGTTTIAIKKATITDHGTSTGWSDAYGDNQAIFYAIQFRTGYWIFDGQTRNENNWDDEEAYGFVVTRPNELNARLFKIYNDMNNVTIKYVYGYFPEVCYTYECYLTSGLEASSNSHNISFTYSMLRNFSSYATFFIADSTGPFDFEHNWIENSYKKELISARQVDYVTFANNIVKNVAGTGAIVTNNTDYWNVSNNVFFSPDTQYTFNDGIITTWTGQNGIWNYFKINGNTFSQMNGALRIGSDGGTGNEAYNNIFHNFTPGFTSYITSGYNDLNSSDVFVDYLNGNYHLSGYTVAGLTLDAPFNTDLEGNIRGVDGVWDRGAYEFTDANSTIPLITNVINGTVTSSTAIVNFTVNQSNALTQVKYSTDLSLSSSTTNQTSGTDRSVTLTSLNGSTKYYYSVFAYNSTNTSLWSNSTIQNFTTAVSYSWTVGVGGNAWTTNTTWLNITRNPNNNHMLLNVLVNDYTSKWEGGILDWNRTSARDAALYYNAVWNNSGLYLDGVDDYAYVSGTLGSPTQITLMGWGNLVTNDSSGSEFISIGDVFAIRPHQWNSNANSFFYDGADWRTLTGTQTYAGTGNHNFAFAFDDTGNAQKFYVDGIAVNTSAYAGSISYSGNTYIGKHGDGSPVFDFGGTIDKIYVYNRYLSNAEVNQTMNNTMFSAGNLTVWYDAEAGYETYKVDVNATTPTNANYTVWYADNGTGSYTQIGGTLTGNNSLTISGTKYQNTDVQVRLAGNSTTTPEIIMITFFRQEPEAEGTTFNQPVYNTGWQTIFINSTQNMTSIRNMMNSSNVNWIAKWNATSQKWEAYKAGWSLRATNSVTAGDGVYIKYQNNDTVTRQNASGSYNWTASVGWNLAGLETNGSKTLSQINTSINTACEADYLVYINPETQVEYTYTCGLTNNESINVGQGSGIWINATQNIDKLRNW